MKKLFALLLAALMVVGLLACGATPNETTAAADNPPADNEQAAAPDEPVVIEGVYKVELTADISGIYAFGKPAHRLNAHIFTAVHSGGYRYMLSGACAVYYCFGIGKPGGRHVHKVPFFFVANILHQLISITELMRVFV